MAPVGEFGRAHVARCVAPMRCIWSFSVSRSSSRESVPPTRALDLHAPAPAFSSFSTCAVGSTARLRSRGEGANSTDRVRPWLFVARSLLSRLPAVASRRCPSCGPLARWVSCVRLASRAAFVICALLLRMAPGGIVLRLASACAALWVPPAPTSMCLAGWIYQAPAANELQRLRCMSCCLRREPTGHSGGIAVAWVDLVLGVVGRRHVARTKFIAFRPVPSLRPPLRSLGRPVPDGELLVSVAIPNPAPGACRAEVPRACLWALFGTVSLTAKPAPINTYRGGVSCAQASWEIATGCARGSTKLDPCPAISGGGGGASWGCSEGGGGVGSCERPC